MGTSCPVEQWTSSVSYQALDPIASQQSCNLLSPFTSHLTHGWKVTDQGSITARKRTKVNWINITRCPLRQDEVAQATLTHITRTTTIKRDLSFHFYFRHSLSQNITDKASHSHSLPSPCICLKPTKNYPNLQQPCVHSQCSTHSSDSSQINIKLSKA